MAFRIWGRNTNLYYLHISGFISVFMDRTHSKVVKMTFVSEFYKIKKKQILQECRSVVLELFWLLIYPIFR